MLQDPGGYKLCKTEATGDLLYRPMSNSGSPTADMMMYSRRQANILSYLLSLLSGLNCHKKFLTEHCNNPKATSFYAKY